MNSYHDYQIYSYEVNSVDRELNFKLAWPNQDKEADVVQLTFSGVHGYELINDSMVSIVLDFEEVSLDMFLSEYGEDIKASYKQNGSYGPWAHDLAKAIITLNNSNAKAYVLSSSIGMEGWILADRVESKNA